MQIIYQPPISYPFPLLTALTKTKKTKKPKKKKGERKGKETL
jgi:hypothetical protein